MRKRVNIYIDGFNFYYGLKNKWKRKYYWLDVVPFFQEFMTEKQELQYVYYFTAVPKNNIGKKDRQDLFFSANKQNPKFKLIFGKYIPKKISDRNGRYFHTFEEKQTDVNIAVEIIRNVVFNKCDTSIIVSADSDLLPAIHFVREFDPSHKIFVYFPPNRYSSDLKNHSDAYKSLDRFETRFKRNLLPENITLPNGYVVKRPKKWQ